MDPGPGQTEVPFQVFHNFQKKSFKLFPNWDFRVTLALRVHFDLLWAIHDEHCRQIPFRCLE